MTHRLTAIFSFCLLAAASCVAADRLDAVFAHMDAAAKTFKGLTANLSITEHQALVDENDVQTGTIKLLRVNAGVTRALLDLQGANGPQSMSLDAHLARIYKPKENVVDEYDITSKQALVNQYLLLGFGAASADLKAAYDISYVGEENIGNQETSHIALIPKSPDVRRNLKQADLWIAPNGFVAQQKFLQPSGDYKLFTYSNMKLGVMPEKDLELNVKKGAQIQKDRK